MRPLETIPRCLSLSLCLTVALIATSCSSWIPEQEAAEARPTLEPITARETIVLAEPGVTVAPEPTSRATSGSLSYEELTGIPAEWDPDHLHLVDFVEATLDYEFRHRFHIRTEDIEREPPLRFPDTAAAFFEHADDAHRAMGLTNDSFGMVPTTDFAVEPEAAPPPELATFDERERLIRIQPTLSPIVEETALLGALTAANQWGNRGSSVTGGLDSDPGSILLLGERRLVQNQWLEPFGIEARQAWWAAEAATRLADQPAPNAIRESWAALGAAYFEYQLQHDETTSVQASYALVPTLGPLMFPFRNTGATFVATTPVRVPEDSRERMMLLRPSLLDLTVALHASSSPMRAIEAAGEIGQLLPRAWERPDGAICVALALSAWDGRPFDALLGALDAWARALPTHRTVETLDPTTINIVGCDPGRGNVPEPADIETTLAPLIVATRLVSLSEFEMDNVACTAEELFDPEHPITLDDPLLREPLSELRAHLPAACGAG